MYCCPLACTLFTDSDRCHTSGHWHGQGLFLQQQKRWCCGCCQWHGKWEHVGFLPPSLHDQLDQLIETWDWAVIGTTVRGQRNLTNGSMPEIGEVCCCCCCCYCDDRCVTIVILCVRLDIQQIIRLSKTTQELLPQRPSLNSKPIHKSTQARLEKMQEHLERHRPSQVLREQEMSWAQELAHRASSVAGSVTSLEIKAAAVLIGVLAL